MPTKPHTRLEISQPKKQAALATGKSSKHQILEMDPKPKKMQTWATKAALLPSTPGNENLDGDFIASQKLGCPVDVEVRLVLATSFGQEGLGFSLSFPRGSLETIEDDGFGICHKCE